MIHMGLDISTYVGVVKVEGQEFVGKCINFPKSRGWDRVQLIAQEFRRTLDVWPADTVTVEGYALGHTSSIVTIVEIGTIIRLELIKAGFDWWEVPPTTLKKWITGKGNAKKADMAVAVRNRWAYSSPSDDVVDAFALAQLGMYLHQNGVETLKGVHKALSTKE